VKRGQATLLIIVGLVIFLIISIVIYLSLSQTNETAETLAKIESLEQASDAVEVCFDEFLEESIFTLGYFGGFMEDSDEFSSFHTVYTLISLEEMESNVERYVQRNIGSCAKVLDPTPFEFVNGEKPTVDVVLGEEVRLELEGYGIVQSREDLTQSLGVRSRTVELDINFIELHDIVQESLDNGYGIPIKSYESFGINTFASEDYFEQLIKLYHSETGFTFRITKFINNS
jgi:hypothetical protein